MDCPSIGVLEQIEVTADVERHIARCRSCQILDDLLRNRRQAGASLDRRAMCARFEALIWLRVDCDLLNQTRFGETGTTWNSEPYAHIARLLGSSSDAEVERVVRAAIERLLRSFRSPDGETRYGGSMPPFIEIKPKAGD